MGPGELRVEVNGFAIAGNGAVQVAVGLEGDAQVEVALGVFGEEGLLAAAGSSR